jgi:hypothetical protein
VQLPRGHPAKESSGAAVRRGGLIELSERRSFRGGGHRPGPGRLVRDALIALNDSGRKLAQSEFYIYQDKNIKRRRPRMYLSGVPYLWSAYRERTFAFASRGQAQKLIDDYPKDLANAKVGGVLVGNPEAS